MFTKKKLMKSWCRMMRCESSTELSSNSNLEDYLSMASLQSDDLEELVNMLKARTNYYREETAKMESAFLKLRLIDDRLQMFEGCMELIEKLNQIQQKFNTKELTPEAILLSHAHKLRKHSNYLAKLKICIKMYIHLNEILSKKINELKCEYELSQKKIDKIVTVTPDEIKIMEKKISRYEHELTKLEKKYPWLKNSDYNLPNISKEINLLVAAKKEKEELTKELSSYHGLKPDLQEASEQLSQIKLEYEEISKKLLDKNN